MRKDTLLIAEDNEDVLTMFSMALDMSLPGYIIKTAKSVGEALQNLEIDRLAAVCTDGNLVDSTGWELARRLREGNYRGPIFYTGGNPFDIPEKDEGLFDEKYRKPVDGMEVAERIREYL